MKLADVKWTGFSKETSIKNITISNFRLFKKEVKFDFEKLSIITGANNSGKSSLIKFISLISSGFKNSDFPAIKLSFSNNQIFEFNDLKNWKSDSEFISFSFDYKPTLFDKPLKVKYKFVDGSKYDMAGYIVFHSVEIFDMSKCIFGIYRYFYDNSFDEFYSSPLKEHNPGIFKFKMNIPFFSKLTKQNTESDLDNLFEHLFSTFGEYWWGETLNEEDIYDYYRLYDLKFEDFYLDLWHDSNCNLTDFNKRDELLFNHRDDDVDYDSRNSEYNVFSEQLKYKEFLQSIFLPFLQDLKGNTQLFCISSHIKSEDILSKAFIELNDTTEYLNKVENILNTSVDKKEYNLFARELLGIFDFNGFIEVKNRLGSGFTIDFIPALLKEYSNDKKKGQNISKDEENAINISKMGSGTGAIFVLILKTLATIYDLEKVGVRELGKIDNTFEFRHSPVILLEEAESLLHPKWQSRLADFIALVTEKYGVQFIIETHSEYFIRKLQYLTASPDQNLKPEHSVIYYLNNPNEIDKGEDQIKKLNIREDGFMDDDFGEGFFDESTRLTIDLLKLQNQN